MSDLSQSTHERMEALTANLPDNKSEKIRHLTAAGYKRADIAKYLGIRYQFVYNVLKAPAPKGGQRGRPALAASSEEQSSAARRAMADQPSRWAWARVGRNGNIDLPEAFRMALAIHEGDQVQLVIEDDAIRILTRERALRTLKDDVRRYVPDGISLVDALISDRRAEAAREATDD